jgi:hypothetical protein
MALLVLSIHARFIITYMRLIGRQPSDASAIRSILGVKLLNANVVSIPEVDLLAANVPEMAYRFSS